eukprot:230114-Chlamydomonas_euryale.AAC.4
MRPWPGCPPQAPAHVGIQGAHVTSHVASFVANTTGAEGCWHRMAQQGPTGYDGPRKRSGLTRTTPACKSSSPRLQTSADVGRSCSQ